MNILAILQDFDGIFLKYSLNITVLCGKVILFFSKNNSFEEEVYETKNMYYNQVYNFCLKFFSAFCVFIKINAKTMIFMGFI